MCDPWTVWRTIQRHLPAAGLRELLTALRGGGGLCRGRTVLPPPCGEQADFPPEAACAVGFPLWRGLNLATTAQVEAAFAEACARAGHDLADQTAVRFWFRLWDDGEPGEVAGRLAAEVAAHLERIEAGVNHDAA